MSNPVRPRAGRKRMVLLAGALLGLSSIALIAQRTNRSADDDSGDPLRVTTTQVAPATPPTTMDAGLAVAVVAADASPADVDAGVALPTPLDGVIPPARDPKTPAVAYPKGASGDAEVRLTLVIAEDGTVRSVGVVTGKEPFASSAVAAVRRWRFQPARSGDVAVAADVVEVVKFRAPKKTKGEKAPYCPPEYCSR